MNWMGWSTVMMVSFQFPAGFILVHRHVVRDGGRLYHTYLTISEKAIVAPTVPAPTIATLAVVGLGIFAGFGVVLI
jgi:hypothetical protein